MLEADVVENCVTRQAVVLSFLYYILNLSGRTKSPTFSQCSATYDSPEKPHHALHSATSQSSVAH